jgi:hypothetical protein
MSSVNDIFETIKTLSSTQYVRLEFNPEGAISSVEVHSNPLAFLFGGLFSPWHRSVSIEGPIQAKSKMEEWEDDLRKKNISVVVSVLD